MRSPGLVVVGASLAGLRAVEAARKAGFEGPVTLVGAEQHLPYDRPPLSKAFLLAPHPPASSTFPTVPALDELGVEVRLGTPAHHLDPAAHQVGVGDDTLTYSSLVIATGCTARTLPGQAPTGVHVLRTVEDAHAIRAGLDAGARTVIVGGGFIGAEVASAAHRRGLPVTIIEAAPLPLVHAVGKQMATTLADLHTRAGVDLRCTTGVEAITGNGRVEKVHLTDGTALDADLVVVGIGAAPAVDWLDGSTLTLDDGVVCDATLRAADDIYAAGDIARWPNPLLTETMRLEHWTSAAEQGTAAGRNAVTADPTEYATVPYFWSDWYEHKIQMVGVAGTDETTIIGDPHGDKWIALYRRGDRLIGALTLNQPGRIMKLRALIARSATWQDALEFTGV